MKSELSDMLEKARQLLSDGKACLTMNLSNMVGRNAYLAVYHAARGYIYIKTGKLPKTHQGVQSLFSQLAHNDEAVPLELQRFVSQAYDLKAVADYEMGADATIPLERSIAALEKAERFYGCIVAVIEKEQGA